MHECECEFVWSGISLQELKHAEKWKNDGLGLVHFGGGGEFFSIANHSKYFNDNLYVDWETGLWSELKIAHIDWLVAAVRNNKRNRNSSKGSETMKPDAQKILQNYYYSCNKFRWKENFKKCMNLFLAEGVRCRCKISNHMPIPHEMGGNFFR